jgi:hypothetical protein
MSSSVGLFGSSGLDLRATQDMTQATRSGSAALISQHSLLRVDL